MPGTLAFGVAHWQHPRSGGQSLQAVLEIRHLILNGAVAPGERLSELALVDRLGLSRTPIRAALARLAGGEQTRSVLRATLVVRKDGDTWRIRQHHFSATPSTPPIR